MNHSTFLFISFGLVISSVNVRAANLKDSFEDSSEESSVSPELRRALKPAEDVILDFIHKLVNTGYASSKIALSKMEKASQSRKDMGSQLQQIFDLLPNYSSKIPVVDDVPRVFKKTSN